MTNPASAGASAPAPRSDWDQAPIWFKAGLHEIGVHEVGDNRGPDVARYCKLAHCVDEGDPWCAIFVNAMLELNGVRGSRSASSQSFRHDPNFVQLDTPALGAITVFWRVSKGSGIGHVAFYRGEAPGRVFVLGGNQHDAVNISGFPRASTAFGLVGFYWPKSIAVPKLGAIPIRAGTPLVVGDKVT